MPLPPQRSRKLPSRRHQPQLRLSIHQRFFLIPSWRAFVRVQELDQLLLCFGNHLHLRDLCFLTWLVLPCVIPNKGLLDVAGTEHGAIVRSPAPLIQVMKTSTAPTLTCQILPLLRFPLDLLYHAVAALLSQLKLLNLVMERLQTSPLV